MTNTANSALFIYLRKPCAIPTLLLECYSGYSSALCPTGCSAALHKRSDHQKANGRKWGAHEILKAFSFGKFLVHGCNPWRWEEFLPIFRRVRKIAKSDY